jgi:hypothetical protein
LGLLVFRAIERALFGLDLGLFMGFSEVHAAPSAAPPQPRSGKITRQGPVPKRAKAALSHHSNAPVTQESQSFLSKKIARLVGRPSGLADIVRMA